MAIRFSLKKRAGRIPTRDQLHRPSGQEWLSCGYGPVCRRIRGRCGRNFLSFSKNYCKCHSIFTSTTAPSESSIFTFKCAQDSVPSHHESIMFYESPRRCPLMRKHSFGTNGQQRFALLTGLQSSDGSTLAEVCVAISFSKPPLFVVFAAELAAVGKFARCRVIKQMYRCRRPGFLRTAMSMEIQDIVKV